MMLICDKRVKVNDHPLLSELLQLCALELA